MYAKWRDQTIAGLSRMGIRMDDIRRLLSAATTMHRIAEIQCSIEISERETRRLDKRDESATKRVRAIAERYGAQVEIQGDPRGCPFSIVLDNHTEHVPGRSLPARCFG